MNKLFTDLSDFDASDKRVMPFGKYFGEEISTVAEQDPRYLGWFRATDWAKDRPGILGRALTYVAMTRARKHLSVIV